ncbi:MAG: hypothetical protein QOF60_97 [Actinomycetota bacterium]|jgi:hypothetical protein|nr:hypothetical protein [Actinomycetota bacterium]
MRRLAIAAVIAIGVLVASGGAASAAANPGASCLGVGSSANAHYPGDRAAIAHDAKDIAALFGTTPGQLISGAAGLHLGTPFACFGD